MHRGDPLDRGESADQVDPDRHGRVEIGGHEHHLVAEQLHHPAPMGRDRVEGHRLERLDDAGELDGADLIDDPFADTDGHRFERWITALYNTGITSGCGTDADGNLIYCPEDGVEWGEFAIMVHRAYVGYTDTSETELTTQEGALAWLTDEGFTTGVLAADLCSTADCKDDEIKRGATALVLRNIWDMTALGDD